MEKKPTGRPSSYNSKYDLIAYQLTLLGATDKQLAEAFSVTEQTINNWKVDSDGNDTSFFESIKKGKIAADGEIAHSLYQRAIGATIKKEQAFKLKRVYWEDGNRCEEEVIETVIIEEQVPPDTGAIAFWLKNRQPALWRDKPESIALDSEPLIEAIRQVLGK